VQKTARIAFLQGADWNNILSVIGIQYAQSRGSNDWKNNNFNQKHSDVL